MKAVIPDYKSENPGHYAPGIISRGMLYISGQLSLDPDTRTVAKGGIREHVEQALANVERVLRGAGASREDVVQCRVYITDIAYWNDVNQVFKEFFGEHKPARIIVPVPQLHFGCLTEIEAVAELAESLPAAKI